MITKIWKKVVEIYTFYDENHRIVDTKKKYVSNGMADEFAEKGGVVDSELKARIESWMRHRTHRFFFRVLDKLMPPGKGCYSLTGDDKKTLRGTFLDCTNDLCRDFIDMLSIVLPNPYVIYLTPDQVKEINEDQKARLEEAQKGASNTEA